MIPMFQVKTLPYSPKGLVFVLIKTHKSVLRNTIYQLVNYTNTNVKQIDIQMPE